MDVTAKVELIKRPPTKEIVKDESDIKYYSQSPELITFAIQ